MAMFYYIAIIIISAQGQNGEALNEVNFHKLNPNIPNNGYN